MSDLWLRKMKTAFKCLDYDGDGVVPIVDLNDILKKVETDLKDHDIDTSYYVKCSKTVRNK